MVIVQLNGRVYELVEDEAGAISAQGKKYRVGRELGPEEVLELEPAAALAIALGLEQCLYHPGVWLRPGEPCQVCLDELVSTIANPAWGKGE